MVMNSDETNVDLIQRLLNKKGTIFQTNKSFQSVDVKSASHMNSYNTVDVEFSKLLKMKNELSDRHTNIFDHFSVVISN